MSQLRAAIIGLGNIAWKYDKNGLNSDDSQTHIGTYGQRQDVKIISAYCPITEDRNLFAEHYDIPICTSIDELLDEKPDIVSICSPVNVHFEQTLECLRAGIPMIWLEKPPAQTSRQIEQLIKAQDAGLSTVLVNFQRRYSGCYSRLKDIYVNKLLGKTNLIRLTYSRGLEANGSHIIDILSYVLGDNDQLRFQTVIDSDDAQNPGFVLQAAESLPVVVNGISVPYHCVDIELTCENGRASILYGGIQTKVELRVEQKRFKNYFRLSESKQNLLGPAGLEGSMSRALDDLIISHKQNTEPRSNLHTAANTIRIIEDVMSAIGDVR
jgi:predicted dehydrogenase